MSGVVNFVSLNYEAPRRKLPLLDRQVTLLRRDTTALLYANQRLLQSWNDDLAKEVEMLGADDFGRDYLKSSSIRQPRALTQDLLAQNQLIAVKMGSKRLFPTFQIDPDTHRPYPQVQKLLRCHPAGSAQDWSMLRWFDQVNNALGTKPLELLKKAPSVVNWDRVLAACQREFADD